LLGPNIVIPLNFIGETGIVVSIEFGDAEFSIYKVFLPKAAGLSHLGMYLSACAIPTEKTSSISASVPGHETPAGSGWVQMCYFRAQNRPDADLESECDRVSTAQEIVPLRH
jgi:hypothetical protein